MIRVTRTISIDESDLGITFVRAPGPGGQNVNKVASAVQLRFDVRHCRMLPDETRHRLIQLAGKRVTSGGVLIIKATRYRTQKRNRQDAIDRLVTWIQRAAQRPKPRHKTKPTAASKKRRTQAKQQRSQTKQLRRSVGDADT